MMLRKMPGTKIPFSFNEDPEMKLPILASALSVAASLLLAPIASASGFILVDRAAGIPMPVVPVRPTRTHLPGTTRPPVVPGPNPHRPPILRGGVSYGLHLQSEAVSVDINDQVAKTYICQVFMNDTDQNLAGTYLFPLPDDTTFSSFSLHIDGKPIEGKILAADEARAQYEAIVRQMIDPGLLEYADYKTVRARIFPIPAHGTKKVELEYTQLLRAENGMLKYRFPLKAQGSSAPVDEIKIDAKLSSKQGLRTIWSPTHTISSQRPNNNQAKVALLSHDTVPDKDFILYYSVSDKDLAANLLTHKNTGEDGYFLLTLSPPVKSTQVIGKDVVLIVDTSGSMQGEKFDQCKKALKYIINAIGAEDRFSIVQFNTDVETFKSRIVPATSENKQAALSFIADLEARGGTNISDALHSGISMLNENTTRPGYMVLMTDGEPTVGETNTATILKRFSPKRDVRVFDFGVGYDVNTKFLNKLAEQHHGTAQYVEPNENLETTLASFYQKIKNPVLSNVQIAYKGIEVKDVYPKAVKDIFAGSQVLLIGKYKNSGKAAVSLTGQVNGVPKAYSFPLAFATDESGHSYLPRLWAMRRIGHLTDIAQENGNNKEVIDEIVALSKQYGIISAYTSFLATDPSENHRLQTASARLHPTPMPRSSAGWSAGGPTQVRGRLIGSSFVASKRHGGGQFSSPGAAAPPPSVVFDARNEMFGADTSSGAYSGANQGRGLPDRFAQTKAAFAQQIAAAPAVGKQAVTREKKMDDFRNAVVLKDEESGAGIKSVEDKTFYLRNGFWTDSSFSEGMSKNMEVIAFGSKQYFDLIRNVPGISKYLAVGQQVILVYKGHCYKITSTPARTS